MCPLAPHDACDNAVCLVADNELFALSDLPSDIVEAARAAAKVSPAPVMFRMPHVHSPVDLLRCVDDRVHPACAA